MNEHKNQSEIERMYQTLREQDVPEMPELWDRIEYGFEEELKKQEHVKKQIWHKYRIVAAAVILITVIAVPVFVMTRRNKSFRQEKNMNDFKYQEEVFMEETTEDAIVTDMGEQEDTYSMAEYGESAEEAALDETANYAEDDGLEEAENLSESVYSLTLSKIDADGNATKLVSIEAEDEKFEQVRELLNTYHILDWPQPDMKKSKKEYYRLEIVFQDESDMTGMYYESAEYLGNEFSAFLQKIIALSN